MNATKDKQSLVALMQQEIRQKKYTRAIVSLKALASVGGDRQLILWHRALLESKVGHLPTALHYVKEIDGALFPKAAKLQAAIEEKIPVFEALIESYNRVVLSMQNERFEQALMQLNEAIEQAKSIPLPTFIYKTKLLLLAKLQKETLARFAVGIPVYASEDEAILKVLSCMQQQPVIAPVPVKTTNGNKKLIVPYAAALAAISFAVYLYVNDKPAQDSVVDDFTKREEVVQETPMREEAEDLDLEDETVEEVVAIPPVFIPAPIAKTYYLTGHTRYKNGQYEEAISHLQMAMASEDVSYFTDDAAYFLIASYNAKAQYADALELAEQLLTNENIHYKQSPYHDATRLQQGKAIYELGNHDEATNHLTELIDKTTVDWVRNEARIMLKTVKDHE